MVFSEKMLTLMEESESLIEPSLKKIDKLIDYNNWKVIRSFQKFQVSDFHFNDSTGYGYNDRGREVLDLVYADIFGADAAIVRPHFVSGTHAIGVALFGILRPGDELLYITGKPYDTLHKIIGKPQDGTGSLQDWGILYNDIELQENGEIDWDEVRQKIHPSTKVIGIQRSRGYAWRPSFSVAQIADMITFVKKINPHLIVFVDNCYGEFTEMFEPTDVGADIMAGSLIKNPGGGLAASGGYIVGKQAFVELASFRLTVPGIGSEIGAMLGTIRQIFQGLFLAPHIVGQALKGSIFAASMFNSLGLVTQPCWNEERTDLIQAIKFGNSEQLIAFVQAIQSASAVDAHVVPEPWDMPGYEEQVIMAAGSFIQGGSLELSADAPLRHPYIAYMQGGLTYSHVKYAVMHTIETLRNRHLL